MATKQGTLSKGDAASRHFICMNKVSVYQINSWLGNLSLAEDKAAVKLFSVISFCFGYSTSK